MQHKRPMSQQGLTFDYVTYGEWQDKADWVTSNGYEGEENAQDWVGFSVQMIDYLANECVRKKNDSVIIRLIYRFLPGYFAEESLFFEIRKQLY